MFYLNKYFYNELGELATLDIPFEDMNNKNILVTGANGLIASYLIDFLIYIVETKKININIYALCRNKEKASKRFISHKNKEYFNLIIQDVCDDYNFKIKFDYIVHAASNAHPKAFLENPIGVIEANVIGTKKLLDYSLKNGNERFLYISSSEVYGENQLVEKYKEDDYGKIETMNFRSCYPESKRMAETLGCCYEKQYGINFISVRPGYIYGANYIEESTRANEEFIKLAIAGKDIILRSKGEQIRSYCYVADCVSAILLILLKGESGKAYNIANEEQEVSIKEFVESLAEVANIKVIFDIKDIQNKGYTKIKNTILDNKSLKALNWKEKFSLNKSIKNILKILKGDN
ncbi:NAD-dependent epimerase/dehydratase family protein [Fusobacterium mortiferum]|uniref:NAD-dependent epimerase/dehydratase family protein n=1 Tax=Fusobacterium mortiferum TaxID=850 RepID=UPI000E550B99|nr:NAD-dependent epimerase/dehydratase family protein [Fusobacterium mortiferum]RHF67225.1 NAD-dependent epimerase/dehydratase family protein [Fusobacterium mortiferum]